MNFNAMWCAFQAFVTEVTQLEQDLLDRQLISKPLAFSNVAFTNAKNYFTSLSRLLTIIKGASSPELQLLHLKGLSLDALGPVYAVRYEGFHFVTGDMLLDPSHSNEAGKLRYTTRLTDLERAIDAASQRMLTLLWRYLGRVPGVVTLEATYRRLFARIEQYGWQGRDDCEKRVKWNVAGALFLLSSYDEATCEAFGREEPDDFTRFLDAINQQDSDALLTHRKLLFDSRLFGEVPPTLPALVKYLGLYYRRGCPSDAIETANRIMAELLQGFGALAWEVFLEEGITDVNSLKALLERGNVKDWIAQLEAGLRHSHFTAEEKKQLHSYVVSLQKRCAKNASAALDASPQANLNALISQVLEYAAAYRERAVEASALALTNLLPLLAQLISKRNSRCLSKRVYGCFRYCLNIPSRGLC